MESYVLCLDNRPTVLTNQFKPQIMDIQVIRNLNSHNTNPIRPCHEPTKPTPLPQAITESMTCESPNRPNDAT
jgi:hypothetical protein